MKDEALARLIKWIINEGYESGPLIRSELRQFGVKFLTPVGFYARMARLEKKGLLKSKDVSLEVGNPPTRFYRDNFP